MGMLRNGTGFKVGADTYSAPVESVPVENVPAGIDEKVFVTINGQEQYILIRGQSLNNPIILYLHGGPANPDSFITYEFAKEICDKYTVVAWDQRGCGRTYFKNKSIDKENKTASFEQAVQDTNELVKYLCKRFNKQRVIIMGHSYGSLLGLAYVHEYPDLVNKYVGVGQVVSILGTQKENCQKALNKANKKESKSIAESFEQLVETKNTKNLSRVSAKTTKYCDKTNELALAINQIKLVLKSPDVALVDFKWLAGMLNMNKHYQLNKQLFDYMFKTDADDIGYDFSVPMCFISGIYDNTCSINLLKAYFEKVSAKTKSLTILEHCGHSPHIEAPKRFSKILFQVLN